VKKVLSLRRGVGCADKSNVIAIHTNKLVMGIKRAHTCLSVFPKGWDGDGIRKLQKRYRYADV